MGVVEQVLMVDQLVGGGSHQRVAWQQDLQFQQIKRTLQVRHTQALALTRCEDDRLHPQLLWRDSCNYAIV